MDSTFVSSIIAVKSSASISDIPPLGCLAVIYFLKRLYWASVASGGLTTLTISEFFESILFCDFEGLKSLLKILADIHALQFAQEGLYNTFCDRLNPCFDKE